MSDENEPQSDDLRKQFPGNNKYRNVGKKPEEGEGRQPRVKKVIQGNVVQRKPSLGKKIKETFVGDDAQTVGGYILFDVIIPATKNLLADMVTQGIERALFGDSRGRINTSRLGSNRTNYGNMYRGGSGNGISRSDEPRVMSRRARANHDFDEIVLSTRGEAEEVLERLGDLVDQFDVATVADLYDLVGITGSFADDKWGWTDLRSAAVARVRDGYLLNLPKTQPID